MWFLTTCMSNTQKALNKDIFTYIVLYNLWGKEKKKA